MKTNTQLLKTIQMLIQLELDKTENKKEKVLSEGNVLLFSDGVSAQTQKEVLNKAEQEVIDKLKELFISGLTMSEISKQFGLSESRIYYYLKKSDELKELKSISKTNKFINKMKTLKAMYVEGMNPKELSKMSGISEGFIRGVWKEIEPRNQRQITFDILKKHYKKGMSVKRLSVLTGFSQQTIFQDYFPLLKKELEISELNKSIS